MPLPHNRRFGRMDYSTLRGRMDGDVLRPVVVVTGCVVAGYFYWRNAHP
jgi:hypothetical protein